MNPTLTYLFRRLAFGASVLLLTLALQAAVPQLLNHQGRIAVDGMNFDGTGQFKFALVNSTGTTTFWSNDGSSNAGGQPTAAVPLVVVRGLYSVLLGDASLLNMTAVPAAVFNNPDVRLRVWFNDGSHGFQLISPDQRLAASPYALAAENAALATSFSGSLAGDVSGTQSATSIAASTVTGKLLTGFSPAAGNLSADDTILDAFNKLDGNSRLKANLNSPTFTGTVGGITASMVGLGDVTNTSDANKPVSTAQQTALDLKAPLSNPSFTGTVSGSFSGPLNGNATTATDFSGSLAGDVIGTQSATSISATTVTGKALTGYISESGTISATDTILTAISKLNGNDALKAPLDSPTFTGTVSGITGSMVGLGNVNNTSDASKPVSSAQQEALNLKAPLASPTFTGTVNGITKSMVGLANVDNTTDASKPVSTAQQMALDLKASLASPTFTGTVSGITASMVGLGNVNNTSDASKPVSSAQQDALDLKAPLASPTFTGTVRLPTGTASVAPLRLATGVSLTTPVFGSVEFDGTNLLLTNNVGSPTRKTLAFTDAPTFTGVPLAPTAASGTNTGQIATTEFVQSAIQGVVGAAPAALDTLNELAEALNDDASYASTITTALSLKAPIANPTFTGTVSGTFSGPLTGDVTGNVSGSAASFTGSLSGDVTGNQGTTSISATTVTGKVLTNYASAAGTITATDTILGAINKLNGNNALKANLASPTFTGTVVLPTGTASAAPLRLATGVSLTTPVFGSVEFDGTNLLLTNNVGSPTRKTLAFTDAPTFTGVPVAPTAASGTNTGQIATTEFVQSAIQGVVGAAPAALDTLNELAEALNDDASYASTITTALSLKAPIANPTFTGTVSGTFSGPLTGDVTGNVSGSAASFTGSLSGDVTGNQGTTSISATTVTGKVLTNYASAAGTITATDTILGAINKLNGNNALKANLASPTFTGTVVLPTGTASAAPLRLATGVSLTTPVFGSVEFDGTNLLLTNNVGSPTRRTIAFTNAPTFTGTTSGTFSGPLTGDVTGNVTGNVSGSAASFTGSLSGDVTGNQGTTSISATTVTGKVLTNYASAAGTITATDTILGAINKLNGNNALKANLASPTFTGTVVLPTGTASAAPLRLATGVSLTTPVFGSVEFDGTNLLLTNNSGNPTRRTLAFTNAPTFTGTTSGTFSGPLTGDVTGNVSGSAASFTGSLSGDVTGNQGTTSISATTVTGKVLTNYASAAGTITATDTILGAINKLNGNNALKANLASPTFTGTVVLPTGTASAAPLRLATGVSLTTPVFGSVEFDGTNLLLTNNVGSPTRKTLAFTDAPTFTGVPVAPTAASGTNTGQIATTEFVQSAIQGVVGAAPAALDTLNELAEALNDDASYASTITTALSLKAPIANPTFTGTVSGTFSGPLTGDVTGNVSGSAASFTGSLSGDVTGNQGTTSISATTVTGKVLTNYASAAGTITATDTILGAINKLNGNNALKANLASPTFTGTVVLPTGTASAAPLRLATGVSLTTPVFGSVEFDGTNLLLTNNSGNPTRRTLAFTNAPTFTGVPVAPTAASGTNTGQIATTEFVQSAIQGVVGAAPAALDTLNELAEALNDDASYASTITTALSLKAPIANPTFTGTVSGTFSGPLTGDVTGNVSGSAASFTGSLSGDVTGNQGTTSISATTVTGKVLTNYASAAGTITATDTILGAINKLNGNNALKANLASPTFTGTVVLPTGTASAAPLRLATGVSLTTPVFGSVEFDGTNLLLTNNVGSPTRRTIAFTNAPTFTGTTSGTFSGPLTGDVTGNVTGNVSGSAASFTGSLSGDVTGNQGTTSISATTVTGKVLTNYASAAGTITATDTILGAINKLNGNNALKANLASPTFTGTVVLPTGTASAAPLRLATGVSLTTPVFGSVEFDGTNLLLTNNSGNPTRRTLAFTNAPTFTGTTSGTFSGPLTGDVTGNVSGSAASFTGSLSGDVTGNQGTTSISATTVTGKVLTNYASAAGTITATDTILGAINKLNGNNALKANLASPTFTGTVVLPTGTASAAPLRLATGVSLTTPVFGSVEFDGTNLLLTNNVGSPTRKTLAFTDAPTFTGVPVAPTAASGTNTGQIATTEFVQSAIQGVVGAAPAALDTLNELAEALNDDASYASTITTALSLKAPIANPTFTGTVSGTFSGPLTGDVTGNVSGSAASFTGSLSGDVTGNQGTTSISATTVTGKVLTNYASAAGTITATDTILGAINKLNGNNALKANLASPTFTGTVVLPTGTASAAPLRLATGVSLTTPVFGSVEFDGTNLLLTNNVGSPTRRTIAFTNAPTFTGTTSGTFSGPLTGDVTGNVTGNVSGSAASFTGSLSGDVTGNQGTTSISATTVTGKVLTNYASAAGTITATDTILTAINKLNGNDALKAPLASPTFTGVPVAPTATSGTNTGQIANTEFVQSAIQGVLGTAQTALDLKAPLANPTFTGTVSGITKSMVGLGNVNNTSDANKPVSSEQQDALDLKAPLASPTFTGTVSGITRSMVGLGNVNNTSDANKPVSSEQQDALDLKAPLASPTFTGTVSGISKSMVGLGNVSNTSDANKPVSSEQQDALDLKAPLASPTFTGTVRLPTGTASVPPLRLATGVSLTTPVFGSVEFNGTNLFLTTNAGSPTRRTIAFTNAPTFTGTTSGTFSGPLTGDVTGDVTGNVTGNVSGSAASFTGSLSGDVTGNQGTTSISATTVTGKVLTNYASAAGTITATDTILGAINKLNGNNALKANLASPTFTGTVVLPTGTASAAPLRLATGVSLTTPVFGSVEFDGTNLLLTNNSGNPTRRTLAFTNAPTFTGVPVAPTAASGTNTGQIATTEFVQSAIQGVVGAAPAALDTLNELAEALNDDASYASTITTALSLKAPIANPTFTGTVSGTFSGPLTGDVTGNVSGSAASFTGSLSGDVTGNQGTTSISATTVTGKVLTNYASAAGTITATDTILGAINKLNGNNALKANLASPTFTGTVVLPTGTASAAPLRLATGVSLTTPVFGSVEFDGTNLLLTNNVGSPTRRTIAFTNAPTFTGTTSGTFSGPLTGDVTGNVTGNVSGSAASFTGSLSGDVTGNQGTTSISATTVTGKVLTNYASAAGTITATDTILGAINKLNGNNALKANLASPTFTGTVVLPTGTASAAPLRLATGVSLTTPVFGSVEFDGTNLFLTTNSGSPTRKTLAFTDSVPPSVPTTSLTAAPMVPVLAWGNNSNGQTTMPALANVAAVAAGESHSLVLLDAGTVIARGLNTSGQVTVPASLTGVTEIAAGTAHNLVRKSDGTLVAWGDNSYGQTTIPSGITTAIRVAAGEKHSLALLANGSVRAWGDNSFGQTNLPASLTGATITAIAAGYDHSLALKNDGTVIAWGRDDAAQVTLPSGLVNVVAIAAGAYHSLALKGDGTVIAWGWDAGGQITVPAGLNGVSKIAGGYAFSMALKNDGTLVVWGDNSSGQTTVPAAATQVTHIAAGASHALALRADAIPAQVARLDQDNVFTGKVGIKRIPAVNSLEVEGAASKTTAGSWLSNSDRRIKTEIQSITGALEKLDQVRLVDFRYTDEYRAAHPSIEDVRYPNVIAQDFAEVFPDNVNSSGEEMADGSPILQVDTYPLIIYSAAAVQELNQENQMLKKQLADQEKRLRKLEALLEE